MYNSNNTPTASNSDTQAATTTSTTSSSSNNVTNSNGYMTNQFNQSSAFYYNTNSRFNLNDFPAEELSLPDLDFLLASNTSNRPRQQQQQQQYSSTSNKSVNYNVTRPPPLTTPAITSFNLLNSLLPLSHNDQLFSSNNQQNSSSSLQAHSVSSSDSMGNTGNSTNSSNDLPNVDLTSTDLDYILDDYGSIEQSTNHHNSSSLTSSSMSMNAYPPPQPTQTILKLPQQTSLINQMHNLTTNPTSNGYSYQKKRMTSSSTNPVTSNPVAYQTNGAYMTNGPKIYSTLTNSDSLMMDYRCLPPNGNSTDSTSQPSKKFKLESNNLSQYANSNSQNLVPQYANNFMVSKIGHFYI